MEMWNMVWDYAKAVGFCRLRGIRGYEEYPSVMPTCELVDDEFRVTQPTHAEPVIVAADYWGHNPRLQLLIYEADGSGEPVVKVRLTPSGKIQEISVEGNHAASGNIKAFFDDRPDTPWAMERDRNPACRGGDLLKMPSGQYGEVMRLRDRYDSYEDYVRYDTIYQVAKRLIESVHDVRITGPVPGDAIEQLWNENPLTVATTDPTDMSIVPEDETELPDPEHILNLVRNEPTH
jgi:hypothetical protein